MLTYKLYICTTQLLQYAYFKTYTETQTIKENKYKNKPKNISFLHSSGLSYSNSALETTNPDKHFTRQSCTDGRKGLSPYSLITYLICFGLFNLPAHTRSKGTTVWNQQTRPCYKRLLLDLGTNSKNEQLSLKFSWNKDPEFTHNEERGNIQVNLKLLRGLFFTTLNGLTNCKVNQPRRVHAFHNYFITISVVVTVSKRQKLQIQLQADSLQEETM